MKRNGLILTNLKYYLICEEPPIPWSPRSTGVIRLIRVPLNTPLTVGCQCLFVY